MTESVSITPLSVVKERNNSELEEDANECLWNGASYLSERRGGEFVAFLMDNKTNGSWPYASSSGASWSSEEGLLDDISKKPSIALSACTNDAELPSIVPTESESTAGLTKWDKILQNAEQPRPSPENPNPVTDDICGPLSGVEEVDGIVRELENLSCAPGGEEDKAQTNVPAPVVHAITCCRGLSPLELSAVPEEDEETATLSSPSTVVSPGALFSEGEDRPLTFQSRSTSKELIEELSRMIEKGDENAVDRQQEPHVALDKLDVQCCCPTGWVHVERDIDFSDPKTRANLLDGMLDVESSSTTSSGSAGSESGEETPDYQHFRRLHRHRRQRKALRVLRFPSNWCSARPSIIDRGIDFYRRYGDKEREAVASFDFLNDIPTSLIEGSDDDYSSPYEETSNCSYRTDNVFNPSAKVTPQSPNKFLHYSYSSFENTRGEFSTDKMKITPL